MLGDILPGITRRSIMQIAKDEGIDVEEKKIGGFDILARNAQDAAGVLCPLAIIRTFLTSSLLSGRMTQPGFQHGWGLTSRP